MLQRIFKALTTPTARNTAVFYFGSFAQSIFRYLFHLLLLRFLTPPEYGEFLSYLSLTYLLSIPMGTITTVTTKYVSEFQGKGDKISTNLFFHYLIKKISPITILLGIALIIFSTPLASAFKANSLAFIVLGISMFISLFQTVIGSYLVAFQKFVFQTIIGFVGVFLTIIFSLVLIRLGFSATGAVIGQLIAAIITTIAIFIHLRPAIYPKVEVKKEPNFSLGELIGFSFLLSLGTMSLISTDVLVVRFLFDPHQSGIYSSLSILGRMILFGLTPIISLVLPVATHRKASSGSANTVLIKLGSVMLIFGFIGAGIFSLFPNFIVSVLSGSAYLEAAPLLSAYAFTMVFFALSQFMIAYLMAIGRPKATYFLLAATLLQPLLFYIFRSSLSMVVYANFVLQLFLSVGLLAYLLSRKN